MTSVHPQFEAHAMVGVTEAAKRLKCSRSHLTNVYEKEYRLNVKWGRRGDTPTRYYPGAELNRLWESVKGMRKQW